MPQLQVRPPAEDPPAGEDAVTEPSTKSSPISLLMYFLSFHGFSISNLIGWRIVYRIVLQFCKFQPWVKKNLSNSQRLCMVKNIFFAFLLAWIAHGIFSSSATAAR
jgi:hypothetical protein